MNLIPLASRLEERGVAQQGRDLFVNFIPQGVPGILLRDHFGGTEVDHYLPGFFKAPFMVIVRDSEYLRAEAMCKRAVSELTVTRRTTIEGVVFNYIRPRALPFAYAPSPGQMVEMAVTMDCCFVDANPWAV